MLLFWSVEAHWYLTCPLTPVIEGKGRIWEQTYSIIVYATVTCDQLLQFDVICHITLLATIIAWRLSPMYYSSVVLSCTLRDLTWPSCTHPWSPELHPTAWKCCRKSELKEIICTLNSIRKGLPDSKIIWRRRRRRRTTAAKFEPTSL